MLINEVAKLTGVTVRALHYYDEIGLLKPSAVTEAGYRIYGADDLERLQQILFFRELDFSLGDIIKIMASPDYDRGAALSRHRALLVQKREHMTGLIELVDKTLKGETDMSFQQFDTTMFEAAKKEYAAEVKARWGDTAAYAESEKKTGSYDKAKWGQLSGEGEQLLQEFGNARKMQPDSAEAAALVKRWQDYITANFYKCSNEILSSLGEMYSGDERFTENIDRFGSGTAAFMTAAIRSYCKKD